MDIGGKSTVLGVVANEIGLALVAGYAYRINSVRWHFKGASIFRDYLLAEGRQSDKIDSGDCQQRGISYDRINLIGIGVCRQVH